MPSLSIRPQENHSAAIVAFTLSYKYGTINLSIKFYGEILHTLCLARSQTPQFTVCTSHLCVCSPVCPLAVCCPLCVPCSLKEAVYLGCGWWQCLKWCWHSAINTVLMQGCTLQVTCSLLVAFLVWAISVLLSPWDSKVICCRVREWFGHTFRLTRLFHSPWHMFPSLMWLSDLGLVTRSLVHTLSCVAVQSVS